MKDAPQYYFTPKGTYIVVDEDVTCAGCRSEHFVFVNRDGKTLCLGCAGITTKEAIEDALGSMQKQASQCIATRLEAVRGNQ